jgi:hypothetical protein
VPGSEAPTATHDVVLGQDTSRSTLLALGRSTLVCNVHVVPLRARIRVWNELVVVFTV